VLLSKPNTDKDFDEGESDRLAFAACSMQVCFCQRTARLPCNTPCGRAHACARARAPRSPAVLGCRRSIERYPMGGGGFDGRSGPLSPDAAMAFCLVAIVCRAGAPLWKMRTVPSSTQMARAPPSLACMTVRSRTKPRRAALPPYQAWAWQEADTRVRSRRSRGH